MDILTTVFDIKSLGEQDNVLLVIQCEGHLIVIDDIVPGYEEKHLFFSNGEFFISQRKDCPGYIRSLDSSAEVIFRS